MTIWIYIIPVGVVVSTATFLIAAIIKVCRENRNRNRAREEG